MTCLGSFTAGEAWPVVTLGEVRAPVAFVGPERLVFVVPKDAPGGVLPVAVDGTPIGSLSVGELWVTGVHQVDSPVIARDGCLYATSSGTRSQESSVPLFRVPADGGREPFATGIRNPTSLTEGPDGALFVSSRFEGKVFRVEADGTARVWAADLGTPCGLAFGADGALFVGDRSGTIFRVVDGRADPFAELPPSVAAFHLAFGRDGALIVAAPTLASSDVIHAIDGQGQVTVLPWRLGRPQGLAVDLRGVLHVADSLAGSSHIFRLEPGAAPDPVVTGSGMLGLAFGSGGEVAVATSDSVYRFASL